MGEAKSDDNAERMLETNGVGPETAKNTVVSISDKNARGSD